MLMAGIRLAAAVVVGFGVLSCGARADPAGRSQVPVGSDFSVAVGQSVLVTGPAVTVAFESVSDDSRCPPDKVCVWEGDATVHVTLTKAGAPTPITLHTSSRFTTTADAAGLHVQLRALNVPGDLLTLRVDPL